jgi:hypothetical protein
VGRRKRDRCGLGAGQPCDRARERIAERVEVAPQVEASKRHVREAARQVDAPAVPRHREPGESIEQRGEIEIVARLDSEVVLAPQALEQPLVDARPHVMSGNQPHRACFELDRPQHERRGARDALAVGPSEQTEREPQHVIAIGECAALCALELAQRARQLLRRQHDADASGVEPGFIAHLERERASRGERERDPDRIERERDAVLGEVEEPVGGI